MAHGNVDVYIVIDSLPYATIMAVKLHVIFHY